MSKSLKALFGLITVLVAIILLLQIDDELSPEASAVLQTVDWQTPNDAYLYYLGIGAKLEEDPLERGEQILSEIREYEAGYDSIDSFDEVPDSISRSELELPDYDGFCGARDKGCIASLFVEHDVPLNDPTMVVVKNRYLAFMRLRGFRTLSKPHVLELYSAYAYLIKGNRLVSLSAIEQARHSDPETAMEGLYSLIELQKKHIAETDTLIGRMIAYALMHETVEVLSILLREFDLRGRPISELSREELNMHKPINREFAFYQSALGSVWIDKDLKNYPAWMVKVVLKPNMTVNAALPIYTNAKNMSELPQVSFTAQAGRSKHLKLKKSWLRNSVGTVLNNVAQIDLEPYIARGLDINAKIVLFNELLNKPISFETLKGTQNPYYGDECHAEFSDEGDRVCFGGPHDDPRLFRCLIILKNERDGSDIRDSARN